MPTECGDALTHFEVEQLSRSTLLRRQHATHHGWGVKQDLEKAREEEKT